MPQMMMKHELEPRDVLFEKLGNLDGIKVYNNQLLVAVYERPKQTAGGIHLTDAYRSEDKWQGKVGLVLKIGPSAFQDADGVWFQDQDIKIGDWIVFRPSDGWGIDINRQMCRMLRDTDVRASIDQPDRVW